MGASHRRLFIMRACALVLLAIASVHCDSDAYTIGQVAHGAGYGGVITGVDYGYGHVAGYGAIGNRGYYGKRDAEPYTIGQVAHGLGYGHVGGYYGKREAEAEADAYTIGQVALGLPLHNAIATGHAHNVGVVTGYGYGHGLGYGY